MATIRFGAGTLSFSSKASLKHSIKPVQGRVPPKRILSCKDLGSGHLRVGKMVGADLGSQSVEGAGGLVIVPSKTQVNWSKGEEVHDDSAKAGGVVTCPLSRGR